MWERDVSVTVGRFSRLFAIEMSMSVASAAVLQGV